MGGIAKTQVIVVDNIPINVYNVLIEHVGGYIPRLTLGNITASCKRTRTKIYTMTNRDRMGGIRQTPGSLQQQHGHLTGQGTSPTTTKTSDGPRVSPMGDHDIKDDSGDQPSDGETACTNTGGTRSGIGQRNIYGQPFSHLIHIY